MFMRKTIDVNTGEVKGGSDSVILRSIAIGSCIAVVAYSIRQRAGAVAHVMLPGKAVASAKEKTRYAVDAVDELIRIMGNYGTDPADIEVCLVGAGNVLEKPDDTICRANIDSVTGLMQQKNIPVKASVLGGFKRRSVMVDIDTGRVCYTEGDGRETFLWQFAEDA